MEALPEAVGAMVNVKAETRSEMIIENYNNM